MNTEDLARLDASISEAARDELPALVGAFERLRALAWARLNCPPAPDADPERLLSLPEVAKVLGVPEDRAYDLARQRSLPVVVIGKYRRVRESALREFIASREDGARPPARRGVR